MFGSWKKKPPRVPTFTKGERCSECGKTVSWSERYAARFCRNCVVWLEKGCKDPLCYWCAERPAKPDPLA